MFSRGAVNAAGVAINLLYGERGPKQVDFGRAVSRFLSAPLRAERIICLSSQYPGPVPRGTWSGPLRGPLFGLAPDGVFRASALALGAVGSYSTFSPLPSGISNRNLRFQTAVYSLWHYPSGCLTASPPACIPQRAFFRRLPQVTRHRALWSSDFPPPACAGSDSPPFQNQRQHTTTG